MHSLVLNTIDRLLRPDRAYQYRDVQIEGFRLIANKGQQRAAGLMEEEKCPTERIRGFGLSPIKPYRDYYGGLTLITNLLPDPIQVRFAIGYTFHTKIVTVDDMSNFGWLRLATVRPDWLYPNLSDQKQLLAFLLEHSQKPAFYVTRVYHYFQFDLYQVLVSQIIEIETKNTLSDNNEGDFQD